MSRHATPPNYKVVVVGDDSFRSPAYEDGHPKDQDRAVWIDLGSRGIACVCDGTSSSWHAAEAAEHTVRFVARNRGFWPEIQTEDRGRPSNATSSVDKLYHLADRLVKELLYLRKKGQELAISFPDDANMSEFEREMRTDTAQDKRKSGYQTTMIAADIKQNDNSVHIRLLKVGDSELFVFNPLGQVVATTAELKWDFSEPVVAHGQGASPHSVPLRRQIAFDHASTRTDVLPDALTSRAPRTWQCVIPSSSAILLTSDGLIDAFDTPGAAFRWLREHEDRLNDDGVLESVHERLRRRKSDDDVSFVWLTPDHFGA